MPDKMGSGNPPGKHSSSYASKQGMDKGCFVNDSAYRGNMHVGINSTAKVVGNQPKERSTSKLESRAKITDPIPD